MVVARIRSALRGGAAVSCARPPIGWYCTRESGHVGPCAARPVQVVGESLQHVIDQHGALLGEDKPRRITSVELAGVAGPGELLVRVRFEAAP
jgi:hypothetical protein